MKLPSVLVFAFVLTLFLFTYGVEGGKNKENKERERRRQERREKRREERKEKKLTLDSNPSFVSEELPTFPIPTMPPVAITNDFGDTMLDEQKNPRRHHHKTRGKDRREKAKKNMKDRQRRKETGTEQVSEPQIVSFSDMIAVREEDPTDPAPAPAPTDKEDRLTEEATADNSIPATSDINAITTTQVDMTNSITTALKTGEPTPTPTAEQQTEPSRRRDREGRKDKKDKKNKKKDKNKKRDRSESEESQSNEIAPTEFEFSPTIQPEPQTTIITTTTTTTTTESRRNDRQKDRQGRRQERKEKRDKKKHSKTATPTPEAIDEVIAEIVINDIVLTPETQTAITDKSGAKTGVETNSERQSNDENIEVESKKKHNRNGERRDRDREGRRGRKEKETERLLEEPVSGSFSDSSTIDECKSDRECAQGSCCEVHEGSKFCRAYNHQQGQKCRDHCSCHSGLICEAPEPPKNSQRKQRFRPSRCRVPGVHGMGGDFVGLVQDALEDVINTMDRPRKGRNE